MYSKFNGIILKKHPLGEADELLTIYTKESGKIRVKAISVRKIESKLGSNLQSLNEIEFETAIRRGAGSVNLPVLISVRVRTVNNFLRENLRKLASALVGAETLYRITPDYEQNFEAYQLFHDFLIELGSINSEITRVRYFQVRLMDLLGYGLTYDTERLSESEKRDLTDLCSGKCPAILPNRVERLIEQAVSGVLEREVKAERFLREIE